MSRRFAGFLGLLAIAAGCEAKSTADPVCDSATTREACLDLGCSPVEVTTLRLAEGMCEVGPAELLCLDEVAVSDEPTSYVRADDPMQGFESPGIFFDVDHLAAYGEFVECHTCEMLEQTACACGYVASPQSCD